MFKIERVVSKSEVYTQLPYFWMFKTTSIRRNRRNTKKKEFRDFVRVWVARKGKFGQNNWPLAHFVSYFHIPKSILGHMLIFRNYQLVLTISLHSVNGKMSTHTITSNTRED